MGNLGGAFGVWRVAKEVLKREDRHPVDLIATGGGVNYDYTNTVMSLDLVTKRYTTLAPMITARRFHATAVVDGKLYVIGGENDDDPLPSVECLDLEAWQWSEVAPMSTPRLCAGVAVLGGKIYVVGGTPNGLQILSSVESFDPATGIWTAVAPMNTPRSAHGVVSAQGKLFAVGGCGEDDQGQDEDLKSVECFDPSTGIWTTINPMNEARFELGVAVLGDKFFAIGGEDNEFNKFSSVECLDLSVPNSAWTPVAPMTMPRSGFGVAVTGGKVYAIGGYGDARSSMECFDPNEGPQGQWTLTSETTQFPCDARFAAF